MSGARTLHARHSLFSKEGASHSLKGRAHCKDIHTRLLLLRQDNRRDKGGFRTSERASCATAQLPSPDKMPSGNACKLRCISEGRNRTVGERRDRLRFVTPATQAFSCTASGGFRVRRAVVPEGWRTSGARRTALLNVANVKMLPIVNINVANWKLGIGIGNNGNT